MNSSYEEWAAGVKQMRPEHKADAETIQIMLADWTADRAALLGLVRELREAIAADERANAMGRVSLARADAALAGEPGEKR
jgi:hypothetical protein